MSESNFFADAFLSQVGSACPGKEPGDYYDQKTGLLHCGKCGEAKEMQIDIPAFGGLKTVKTMCRCMQDQQKKMKRDMELAEEQHRVDLLMRFSIIDKRFKNSTFDRFVQTRDNAKAYRIARNYVDHFEEMYARAKGLMFFGQSSRGKTFIASCIANALLANAVPVVVTSTVKLASPSGLYSREGDEQRAIIANMNAARLLVLDDLGAERDTSFKAEQVFDLIDSRYNSNRPLIVTTNLSLRQMQDETDIRRQRVYERLFEMCYPVECTGPSWRQETAANDYDEISKILMG